MARADRYSLLLLAGGRSSRMGKNKAELLYNGKPFWAHMVDKVRPLGITRCLLSGYDTGLPQIRTVWDRLENRGPLGGLHAGLSAAQTPYCLVLPVDAPLLPAAVPQALLRAHEGRQDEAVLIWEHGDRPEPIIAVYPTAMAGEIEALIREKSAPVFRALDRWGYRSLRLEPEEDLPLNINTPELYGRLLNLEGPF